MAFKLNPFTGKLETSEPGPKGDTGTVAAAGDGSQGTPSISFTSDPDTGFYKYTTNGIGVSTAGTGRLFINSNGNVGIGATSANSSLLVQRTDATAYSGTARNNQFVMIYNPSTAAGAYAGLELHVDGTGNSSTANISVIDSGSGSADLAFGLRQNNVFGEKLRINAAGNVGVGTSSPQANLHIVGASGGAGEIYVSDVDVSSAGSSSLLLSQSGNNSFIYNRNTSGQLRLGAGGASNNLVIATSGNVGVGTTSPDAKLEIVTDTNKNVRIANASHDTLTTGLGSLISFSRANDGIDNLSGIFSWNNGGLVTAAREGLVFATGGGSSYSATVERLRIDSSGNVGIGTSSPDSNLEIVNSTASADNSLLKLHSSASTSSANLILEVNNGNTAQAGVRLDTANKLHLQTYGGGALNNILTLSGSNVGIGTTSPASGPALTLNGTSNYKGLELQYNGTGIGHLIQESTGALYLGTKTSSGALVLRSANQVEAARIDSSGRLLVGTSSSLLSYAQLQVTGGSDNAGHICLATTFAAPTSGQNIGSQRYTNSAGGIGAIVGAEADSAWTAGSSYPTRLVFSTTANAASSPTERMRIDSSGNVGIGTTSPAVKLHIQDAAANAAKLRLGFDSTRYYDIFRGSTTNSGLLNFYGSQTGYTGYVFDGVDGERMRIDSAGRVGIGTSSPISGGKLTVDSGSSDNFTYYQARGANSLESSSVFLTKNSSGTNVGGSIGHDGSTNTLYLTGLTTGAATQHVSINSSGNVGINTTNPDSNSQLHVVGSSYQPLFINTTGTGGGGAVFQRSGTQALYTGTGGSSWLTGSSTGDGLIRAEANLIFATNGNNQRAQIDSSGRLLVGASSSDTSRMGTSTYNPQLQVKGAWTNGTASITCTNDYPVLWLNGTAGTVANAGVGRISFNSYDGTNYTQAATIDAQVDGTPGADDMPGRLVFSTTADGASSPTERMRINNQGQVGIGSSGFSPNIYNLFLRSAGNTYLGSGLTVGKSGSDYDGAGYNVGWQSSTSTYKYVFSDTAAFIKYGSGGGRIETFTAPSGTGGNSISFTAGPYVAQGGTSWTSSSDERLKEDLLPIENGLAKVGSLRAVTGRFKTDDVSKRRSFLIAQDVQTVLPEAVDTVDPEALGLDYVAVIPLLVAALKESKQRIETLEAKVAALEAN